MREYEAVFVFRAEDELFKQGKNLVQEQFKQSNVSVAKEEDLGVRDLAYSVKGEDRGHYYLFVAQAEPEVIAEINESIRLVEPVLKHLFVRPN